MKKIISFISLVAFSSVVLAASGSISFTGTASTTCNFTTQMNGSLGVDPAQPNILASNVGGATPATLGISYFGTPTVSVEEITTFTTKPNGVSAGDFTYTTLVSSVAGVSYTSSGGYKTATYSTGSSDTLTINFYAGKSSGNIALGNYVASSAVTCQ